MQYLHPTAAIRTTIMERAIGTMITYGSFSFSRVITSGPPESTTTVVVC
jgi:hypothetical protein